MKKKQNQALYDALTNAADLIKSQKYSYLPSNYIKVDYPDSEYLNACDEAFCLIESLANEYKPFTNCCDNCLHNMTIEYSNTKQCRFTGIRTNIHKECVCGKYEPKK